LISAAFRSEMSRAIVEATPISPSWLQRGDRARSCSAAAADALGLAAFDGVLSC
jgi:hypothetical protein